MTEAEAERITNWNAGHLDSREVIESMPWYRLETEFRDGKFNSGFCRMVGRKWFDGGYVVTEWEHLDMVMDFEWAMEALSDSDKRLLLLYFAGYTQEYIGGLFGGMSQRMVSYNLRRIRELLRKKMTT